MSAMTPERMPEDLLDVMEDVLGMHGHLGTPECRHLISTVRALQVRERTLIVALEPFGTYDAKLRAAGFTPDANDDNAPEIGTYIGERCIAEITAGDFRRAEHALASKG